MAVLNKTIVPWSVLQLLEENTMADTEVVNESEVLRATVRFLIERRVIPYQFSLTNWRSAESRCLKSSLTELLKPLNMKPEFCTNGPDVVGVSREEFWQVECKGAGTGKAQTQRNNFDRALASVVSYYVEDSSSDLPEESRNTQSRLGLALPSTRHYLRELERRVRKPLRKRLNLWILLYEMNSKSIRAITPIDEFQIDNTIIHR